MLAIEKLLHSKLLVPRVNKRIGHADFHLGVASVGVVADGRALLNATRREAQNFRDNYDSNIPIQQAAERLSNYVQQHTLYSSLRPFGASALLAGIDDEKGPQLYVVEPSGVYFGYYAAAVGKGKTLAKTELEKLDLSSLSLKDALKEAARIVYMVHDDSKNKEFELEMSWIGESETGGRHQIVPQPLLDECIAYAKNFMETRMDD